MGEWNPSEGGGRGVRKQKLRGSKTKSRREGKDKQFLDWGKASAQKQNKIRERIQIHQEVRQEISLRMEDGLF